MKRYAELTIFINKSANYTGFRLGESTFFGYLEQFFYWRIFKNIKMNEQISQMVIMSIFVQYSDDWIDDWIIIYWLKKREKNQ